MNDFIYMLNHIKDLISNNKTNEVIDLLYTLDLQEDYEIDYIISCINNFKRIYNVEFTLREREVFNVNKNKYSPITLWGGIFDTFKIIDGFNFSIEEIKNSLKRMKNLSILTADFDGFIEKDIIELLQVDCFTSVRSLNLIAVTSNFLNQLDQRNQFKHIINLRLLGYFKEDIPLLGTLIDFNSNCLNTLDLSESKFYTNTKNFFKDFKASNIVIDECYFKYNPIESLKSLSDLKEIFILNTNIKGVDDFEEVVDLLLYFLSRGINSIGISGDFVNSSFINNMINNLAGSQLEFLSLKGSYDLTNEYAEQIATLIRTLNVKKIDISYTQITGLTLLKLIHDCPECTFIF